METLAIGTRVHVDGYDGVVIANNQESHYGACPASMVIVRLAAGIALKEITHCRIR